MRALHAGQEVPLQSRQARSLEWHPIAAKLLVAAFVGVLLYAAVYVGYNAWRDSRVDTWSGPDTTVTSGQRLADCPVVNALHDDDVPDLDPLQRPGLPLDRDDQAGRHRPDRRLPTDWLCAGRPAPVARRQHAGWPGRPDHRAQARRRPCRPGLRGHAGVPLNGRAALSLAVPARRRSTSEYHAPGRGGAPDSPDGATAITSPIDIGGGDTNATSESRCARRGRRDDLRGVLRHRHPSRRRRRTAPPPSAAASASAPASASAVARARPAQQPVNGGKWIFGSASDPSTLDAILIQDGESFRIAQQIYETLIKLKPGTTCDLRPGLAKSWDLSADGLTYTFHLQTGVKFSDGTAFNADAAVYNVNRWKNLAGAAPGRRLLRHHRLRRLRRQVAHQGRHEGRRLDVLDHPGHRRRPTS